MLSKFSEATLLMNFTDPSFGLNSYTDISSPFLLADDKSQQTNNLIFVVQMQNR
jgi:hypothetical protein